MLGGAHSEHSPLMPGLEPDTEYHYRVQGTADDVTPGWWNLRRSGRYWMSRSVELGNGLRLSLLPRPMLDWARR